MKKKITKLVEQANMDVYGYNTSVIQCLDDSFRVAVRTGSREYGDCVEIGIMNESEPGLWRIANFSPARARLIAHFLMDRADRIEAQIGKKIIDKPEKYGTVI